MATDAHLCSNVPFLETAVPTFLSAILVALAIGDPVPARAQQATGALDQLELAPPSDTFLTIPSTRDPGFVRPSFGAYLSFAHQPLVLANSSNDTEAVVVSHQLLLHLQAAIGLVDRLTADIDAPFTLSQSGDGGGGPRLPSPKGAAVNDLRLGLRGVLVNQERAFPGLSAGLDVWFPTGNAAALSGASVVRFGPSLNVGGDLRRFVWGASVSARFQPSTLGALLGSQVRVSAGAAGRVAFLQLGPELTLSIAADSGTHPFAPRTVGFETLLSARAFVGPVALSLAGGPAFGRALGTPTARVIAGASVAFDAVKKRIPPSPPHDDAGHAATNGAAGGGASGTLSGGEKPSAGAGSGDSAMHEVVPQPPQAHEQPSSVRLEEGQIVILEQVHFKTASAIIDSSSFDLLGQIAKVLNAHPDIARIAVDGHTDNFGSAASNLLLSRQRAMAVVEWLTEHGVDARRTEARGFGARQPLTDNFTEEHRAKNRRVEFIILRTTSDGMNGWEDGTIVPNVTPNTAGNKP